MSFIMAVYVFETHVHMKLKWDQQWQSWNLQGYEGMLAGGSITHIRGLKHFIIQQMHKYIIRR